MGQRPARAALTLLLLVAAAAAAGGAQTPSEVFEAFREWLYAQPRAVQDGPDEASFALYRAKLETEGLTEAEADRRIAIVREQGKRLEIERWNRILTAGTPRFNSGPNAFLVEMASGRTPGVALDVGMGQGRNAIYLARQGWQVTGFDPAEQAVALAQKQAADLGVRLTTHVQSDEEFEFGSARWDLIVLSYVGVRGILDRIHTALKPGGIVVLEAYHRDATQGSSIGRDVVWDTNELLVAFGRLRIIRYEDTEAPADFGGRRETRVVRLCAQKP